MILDIDFILRQRVHLYICRRQLTDFAWKSKYYENSDYTDKDDQIICLIKFVSPEYLLSTLFGNFRYTSLYEFRKLEIKNGDKKIGDAYEGIYPYDFSKPMSTKVKFKDFAPKLVSVDTKKKKAIRLVKNKNGYGLDNHAAKKVGIISFYAIRESQFDNDKNAILKLQNEKRVTKKLNDVILKMMKEFNQEGRFPIIIPMLKSNVFTLQKNSLYSDMVNYVDEASAPESFILNKIDENPFISAFYKRRRYKNQLEYRLVDCLTSHIGETKHFCNLKNIMTINSNDLGNLRLYWE